MIGNVNMRRHLLKLLRDPKLEAEALSIEELVDMAGGRDEAEGPTATEEVAGDPGPAPGKKKPAVGPRHRTGEPALTLPESSRSLFDEFKPALDAEREDSDLERAAVILQAGGAVKGQRPEAINQRLRNLAGKDVISTPQNAQNALDKYLRHGGPMPSVAQLAALGKTREEVEEARAEKVLSRRGRNGIMGLDEA